MENFSENSSHDLFPHLSSLRNRAFQQFRLLRNPVQVCFPHILHDILESGLFSATMFLSNDIAAQKKNDRPKGICSPEKYRMKRTKGDETPLRVQGQERVSGRTAGVQRAAGPLLRGPEGETLGPVK